MAFIGTPLDTRNTFQSLVGKRFNGDGSETDFTLDVAPSSVLDIEVFVGNVRQDPNSAYTLSGTTLTFTGAPPSGTNNIYVVHQAKSVGTIDVPTSSVTSSSLSGNLVTPGTLDVNGQELILDADADTSITADTDDQIDIKTGGTDRLKIDSTDVTVSTGNIVFGTANKGVYLGVTSATAANLLDDYEEGTWTPTFSSYSGTDQNATGYYTKVGNLVTAGCRIGTDGTSDSSVATIAGLPFTVRASTEDGAIGGGLVTYTTGLAAQRWYAINNTATVKCANGTGSDVNYNDFGANKTTMLIITYFV